MKEKQVENEKDLLRAAFTVWLETLIYRTKLNYLRKEKETAEIVSFEEMEESLMETDTPFNTFDSSFSNPFEKAFSKLPNMRKQVLTMLFVQEMTPQEIATKLQCTVQHVYNQRSKAIKTLRELLRQEEIEL